MATEAAVETALALPELRAEIARQCPVIAKCQLRLVSHVWERSVASRELWSDISDPLGRFRASCAEGRLAAARWLATVFTLGPADARADHNYALRWVCAGGHTETAQWLVERFALGPEDARAWDNAAL